MSAVESAPGARPAPVASAGPNEPGVAQGLVSTRLLRSEMRLIADRRRNQMGLLVLAAVPVLMAVAVKLSQPRPGRGPDFLSSITSNGLFVPLAALTVEMTLFLPLAMAMLAGDAIAGEANLGTLRYLLTVPVGRTRLLAVKYASLCIGAVWGVGLVAVAGALVGIVLFGTGPMVTLSGSQISFGESVWRIILITLYLSAGIAGLGAVGLFISTLTEQPMAATVALTIFTILSWIIVSVPQVSWIHPWLIVDQWMAFGDLLRDPPAWGNILQGLAVDAGYAVVFWLAAWARFGNKDITS